MFKYPVMENLSTFKAHSFAILFTSILFCSSASMAQVKKPIVAAATKKMSILEAAFQQATQDKNRLEKALAAENVKVSGNNICITNALSWQLRSAEWFLVHHAEFQKIEGNYDGRYNSVLAEANQKWSMVRTTEIGVLAVKGQKEEQATINFDKMADYLSDYNSKLKVCAPNQRRDLRKVQGDPRQNKYGVAVDQMVVAANQMTDNINASLKQSGNQFELVFSEAECGFKLEFRAKYELNGKTETIVFDALEIGKNGLSVSEEDKWSRLLAEVPSIDSASTDGASRLKQFETEAKLSSCERSINGKLPSTSLGVPYQNLSIVQAAMNAEIASGARGASRSSSARSAGSQEWVEVTSTAGVAPKGIPTQVYVLSDGRLAVGQNAMLSSLSADGKWTEEALFGDQNANSSIAYDSKTGYFLKAANGNVYFQAGGQRFYVYNFPSNHVPQEVLGLYDGKLYIQTSTGISRCNVNNFASDYIGNCESINAGSSATSLSFTAQNVFGVVDGEFLKFDTAQNKWVSIAGADYNTFGADVIQAFAVSNTEMYVLTRSGDLYQYMNREWQLLVSSSGSNRIIRFAANKNGKVCGISFNSKIWCVSQE